MDPQTGWAFGSGDPHEGFQGPGGRACPACGAPNGAGARFCQACGASLSQESQEAEASRRFEEDQGELAWIVRDDPQPTFAKVESPWALTAPGPVPGPVVTAVVCEVSPRRRTDPLGGSEMWDAAGALEEMAGALEEIRAVLERHGGAVDQLAGSPNTLVAVFGPEPDGGDGPLRAVRAAAEIRQSLPPSSDEATGATGSADPLVQVRSGIGASEVQGPGAGAARLWEQRVVDLAVRLQRMAEPGEVIVGEGVYRRVGGSVEVQPVDGRARMDGTEPMGPLRLLDVVGDVVTEAAPQGSAPLASAAPLVGRDAELGRLRESLHRAASGPRCSLMWVVGEAGIGKTRLVETFLNGLEEDAAARVIRVRCRSSADGGTMWPVADLVERAAWVTDDAPLEEVRAKLHRLFGDGDEAARATECLAIALGIPGTSAPEETPWAVRRLLEAAAPNGPLVVFVDDADRAGPGFVELLAGAAQQARDAAALIVLAGRTEPESRERTDEPSIEERIRMGPLDEPGVAAIVGALLQSPDVDSRIVDPVASTARGNPFVAEQALALLIDRGQVRFERRRWVAGPDAADLSLPVDVANLLLERLEALDAGERDTLGLAAALGETFPLSLLVDLTDEPARRDLGDRVLALTARLLLRPDAGGALGALDGEEAYGCRHPLIRAAAQATVEDDVRARAHERSATWLQSIGGERPDRHAEEIGSHLESARRLRRGGENVDDHAQDSRQAAAMLATAGATGARLGDRRGAVQLWLRASSLLDPNDPVQPQLLLETALVLSELGEHAMAEGLLTQCARAARQVGDRAAEWRTRLAKARIGASGTPEALDLLRETADAAMAVCRELGDDVGLAWAWSARGLIHSQRGHFAAAAGAADRSAEHARRAGRDRDELSALRELAGAIEDGPAPITEAVERCEEILGALHGRRPAESEVEATLALLLARQGRLDEARARSAAAVHQMEALGLGPELASCLLRAGRVEAIDGELEEARRLLQCALEVAERSGDSARRGVIAASLSHVAVDLGDPEWSLALTKVAEQEGAPGDVASRVRWLGARARALARGGRADEAKPPARLAVQLADQTDLIDLRVGALLDLADVLVAAGRPEEAAPLARKALRTLERKGASGSAARARAKWDRSAPKAERSA
jgi:tetratricopeptide (TPR) repeat protein